MITMKKLFLILSLVVFCGSNLYSQFGDGALAYIAPLEGLATAEAEMQKITNDYSLVGIATFSGEITLPMAGSMAIQMTFSGEHIGKSNMWEYFFVDKTTSEIIEIAVFQVIPMENVLIALNLSSINGGLLAQMSASFLESINLDTDLELSSILSSEEWVPQLIKKEEATLNDEANYIFGVWMPVTLRYGHTNQFNWYCINVADNGNETWCYSLASSTDITCESPNNIVELPIVNVEISPNPVTTELIILVDTVVKDVNIYDISGNLVKQCGQNVTYINVSDLLAGTYHVSFSIDDTKIFRRFVKI